MESIIPLEVRHLFSDGIRAFAFLATIMPDGSPQVTPVWFDMQDDLIRINTRKGRVKERNMRARPKVALAIMDPENPLRYVQIRGEVVEMVEEGAVEHLDRLIEKYTLPADYGSPPRTERVMCKIRPEAVTVGA